MDKRSQASFRMDVWEKYLAELWNMQIKTCRWMPFNTMSFLLALQHLKNKKYPYMTFICDALMWKIILLLQSGPYLYVDVYICWRFCLVTSTISPTAFWNISFTTNLIIKSHRQFLDFIFILSGFLLSWGCMYKTKLMYSDMQATQQENETIFHVVGPVCGQKQ